MIDWPNLARRLSSGAYFSLFHRFHTPKTPKILMYHSIGRDEHLSVSRQQFRAQLCFFQKYYRISSLEEVISGQDRYSVALTFDDGYRDFYERAVPILREFNVPATVFVVSSTITDDEVTFTTKPTMTVSQLAELASDPLITIGNHTHTHPDLASLPPQEQREEILSAKGILEDKLGVNVSQFAYPGGSYDESCRRILAESHDSAVTVNKLWEPYSRYTYPRLHAHRPDLVRWQLNSFSHFYHSR